MIKKISSIQEHGILLVYKPPGISSFDLIRQLRKKLNLKKMGHSGTLDPFAVGLVVILIGEATKFQDFLMQQSKEYLVNILLGRETDTLDPTGKLIRKKEVDFNRVKSQIDSVIENNFIGMIDQVPPEFSAIKIQGKRAYQLSRQGEKVCLKSRKVWIKSIEVIEVIDQLDQVKVIARVTCGAGCYMRSLARDLARQLGTVGMVDWLERTKIGRFKAKNLSSWSTMLGWEREQLLDQLVRVDDFLSGRNWSLSQQEMEKLKHGNTEFLKERLKQGYNLLYFRNKLMAVIKKENDLDLTKLSMIYNLIKYY